MSASVKRRQPPPQPPEFPIADHIDIKPCLDPESDGDHAHVTLHYKNGEIIAGFTIDAQLVEFINERCRAILKQPALTRTH